MGGYGSGGYSSKSTASSFLRLDSRELRREGLCKLLLLYAACDSHFLHLQSESNYDAERGRHNRYNRKCLLVALFLAFNCPARSLFVTDVYTPIACF